MSISLNKCANNSALCNLHLWEMAYIIKWKSFGRLNSSAKLIRRWICIKSILPKKGAALNFKFQSTIDFQAMHHGATLWGVSKHLRPLASHKVPLNALTITQVKNYCARGCNVAQNMKTGGNIFVTLIHTTQSKEMSFLLQECSQYSVNAATLSFNVFYV